MELQSSAIIRVRVTISSEEEILEYLSDSIAHNYGSMVVTPNPEIIVAASRNPAYLEILNNADISLPDGTGIVVALRLQGIAAPRIRGRDFFVSMLNLAEKNNYKVYLVGSNKAVLDTTITRLNTQYPHLSVKACFDIAVGQDGRPQSNEAQEQEQQLIEDMKIFKPKIVFVALGHPKQEFWIARMKSEFPQVVFMAVGGTLTTYSGALPTPPKLISKLGLEWLFRLILEPRRIKRIFVAVCVFPILIIWNSLKKMMS